MSIITKKRDDLQSLRGIAILAVILFHLKTDFFTNGHLGVDIFFVLSGYFIFSMHCLPPRRSLYSFFSKRIWRIFPAYYICLLHTTVASYVILNRQEFTFYVQELRKASCFVTNWKHDATFEEQYFEQIQEQYFLLHTWSLSVEIQFYLISPLVAVFLEKAGKFAAVILILVSAGLQFYSSPTAAFYNLSCRLWQFLFGFLAVCCNSQILDYLHVEAEETDSEWENDGLLGNIYSKKSVNESETKVEIGRTIRIERGNIRNASKTSSHQFLRYVTIVKTSCAISIIVIILLSNLQGYLFVHRVVVTLLSSCFVALNCAPYYRTDIIFNNKVLNFLGEISYGWYLYHWPFAVFISYFELDIIEQRNFAIYAIAPFCLAVLCRYILEKPLMTIGENFGRCATAIAAFLPPLLCFCVSSLYLYYVQNAKFYDTFAPFSDRPAIRLIPPLYGDLVSKEVSCQYRTFDNSCFIGDKNATHHTVILGDSHARTVFSAHEMLPQEMLRDRRVTLLFSAACIPFFQCKLNYTSPRPYCQKFMAKAFDQISAMRPTKVILAARFISSYRFIMADVRSEGKELIRLNVTDISLVLPIPESDAIIPSLLERTRKSGGDLMKINMKRSTYDAKMKGIIEAMKRINTTCSICSLYNPTTALCDEKYCYTISSTQEPVYPLYYDNNHLNDFGVLKMSDIFA